MFIKYRIVFYSILFIAGIIIKEHINPGLYILLLTTAPLVLLIAYKRDFYFLLLLPVGIVCTPVYGPSPKLGELENKQIDITGTITKNPELRENSTRLFFETDTVITKTRKMILREKLVLYSTFQISGISAGDSLKINDINLERIKSFNNPGVFDLEKYYSRKDIFFSGFINDKRDINAQGADPQFNSLLYFIQEERQSFTNHVRKNVKYPESEIINALSVGVKSYIPERLRERFAALGISHIFAISGLHIGAVAFAFYRILKWLLKRSEYVLLKFQVQRISALVTIFPVFIYTSITGFSTSAVRASIMVSAYLLSLVIGREDNKINTLALAAILILFADPYAIHELSFRLSFLAVLGILLLHRSYPFRIRTFFDKVATSIKVTSAATVCTLPLTVNSFGYLPVSTMPANLLILPVVEIFIMPLSIVSILLFRISEELTTFVLRLDSFVVSYLLDFTRLFDKLGITYLTFPDLRVSSIVLLLLTFSGILFIRSRKTLVCLMILTTPAFIFSQNLVSIKNDTKNLAVSYLDSGYKNISLAELPAGKTMLFKGGYSLYSSSDYIEEAVVVPFLLSKGITKVDYLILTSLDTSHINGTISLLKMIEVENLWTNGSKLNGNLWKIIKEKGIRWKDISADTETFTLQGVRFRFIKPRGEFKINDSRKPLPLIISMKYRDKTYLMGERLGNIYVQKEIKRTYKDFLEADVLYLAEPETNSRTKNFPAFTGSDIMVCKSCDNIEKSLSGDIRILQTDRSGMIEIVSDGNETTVNKFME